MTILDTFYLLFKTDIPASAGKDIAGLNKQISELAAKGKKRSDEETKQLNALRKQRRDATQDLRDQRTEVDRLGSSFTGLVEGVGVALAAYGAFSGIKNGILDAARLNSVLELQGKITGKNITEIKAFGAASEAAGGSASAFSDEYYAAFQKAASAGLRLPDPDAYDKNIRAYIAGRSQNEKLRLLSGPGGLGITDPGRIALLEQSDKDYANSIALAREHAAVTAKDGEAALAFENQLKSTNQTFATTYTRLGTEILPAFTGLLRVMQELGGVLNNNSRGISSFVDKATNMPGPLSIFKNVFNALSIIGKIPQESAGGTVTPNSAPSSSGSLQQKSLDFWISQGYTPEQAAGIVANEKAESNFNPSAVGDGGAARGSFQWHVDRRNKILAATGIDVATAGHLDQLRAAAYELQQTGIGDRIKNTSTAGQAGALFSSKFERPAGGIAEAMRRAGIATSIAAQSSIPAGGGGGSTSVKIDDINVHTQSTDASAISRDIGAALRNELSNVKYNLDDAWKA